MNKLSETKDQKMSEKSYNITLKENNNLAYHVHQNNKKSDKQKKIFLLNVNNQSEDIKNIDKIINEDSDDNFKLIKITDILVDQYHKDLSDKTKKNIPKNIKNLFVNSYNYNKVVQGLYKNLNKSDDSNDIKTKEEYNKYLLNKLISSVDSEDKCSVKITTSEIKDTPAQLKAAGTKAIEKFLAVTISSELFSVKSKYKVNVKQLESMNSSDLSRDEKIISIINEQHELANTKVVSKKEEPVVVTEEPVTTKRGKAKKDDVKKDDVKSEELTNPTNLSVNFKSYFQTETESLSKRERVFYLTLLSLLITKHDKKLFKDKKEKLTVEVRTVTENLTQKLIATSLYNESELENLFSENLYSSLDAFKQYLDNIIKSYETLKSDFTSNKITLEQSRAIESSIYVKYKDVDCDDDDDDDDDDEEEEEEEEDNDDDEEDDKKSQSKSESKVKPAKVPSPEAVNEHIKKLENSIEKYNDFKLLIEGETTRSLKFVKNIEERLKQSKEYDLQLKELRKFVKNYTLATEKFISLRLYESYAREVTSVDVLFNRNLSELLYQNRLSVGSKEQNCHLNAMIDIFRKNINEYKYKLQKVLDKFSKCTEANERSKNMLFDLTSLTYTTTAQPKPETKQSADSKAKKPTTENKPSKKAAVIEDYLNFLKLISSNISSEFSLTIKLTSDTVLKKFTNLLITELSKPIARYIIVTLQQRSDNIFNAMSVKSDFVEPKIKEHSKQIASFKNVIANIDATVRKEHDLVTVKKSEKDKTEKASKAVDSEDSKRTKKPKLYGFASLINQFIAAKNAYSNDNEYILAIEELILSNNNKITSAISAKELSTLSESIIGLNNNLEELGLDSHNINNLFDKVIMKEEKRCEVQKIKKASTITDNFLEHIIGLSVHLANIRVKLINNKTKYSVSDNKFLDEHPLFFVLKGLSDRYNLFINPSQQSIDASSYNDYVNLAIASSIKNQESLNTIITNANNIYCKPANKSTDGDCDKTKPISNQTAKIDKDSKSDQSKLNARFNKLPFAGNGKLENFIKDSKKYIDGTVKYDDDVSSITRDYNENVAEAIKKISLRVVSLTERNPIRHEINNNNLRNPTTKLIKLFFDINFGLDSDTISLFKKLTTTYINQIGSFSHKIDINKSNSKKKKSINDENLKETIDLLELNL